MNATIPMVVAFFTMASASVAMAQNIGPSNAPIGMGPWVRANSAIADRIEQLRSPRPTVPYLTGSFVRKPVTVQGKGPATIVAGNTIVNTTNRTDSLIKIKCPNAGHKIIMKNNRVVNQGQIVSSQTGGTTGAVVVQCDGSRSTLDITGNNISGSGKIIGR